MAWESTNLFLEATYYTTTQKGKFAIYKFFGDFYEIQKKKNWFCSWKFKLKKEIDRERKRVFTTNNNKIT